MPDPKIKLNLDLSDYKEESVSGELDLDLSDYNSSQKKKSTPTSTPQKSVSGTPTGSSGGKNSSGFPKIDMNSVAPGYGEQPDYNAINLAKSKRVKELETSFYASTKDNTDDAVAEQRLQDRKANKGFWNTAEDLTKSAYNKVIGGLASIADEQGIRDLKISEDPLADEKKQALLEAKKNKITLTEAQKNSRAEEIFKQKEKDNLFIDRANSYLDNLDVKDKDILEQSRLDKSTHLQLENQKKFKVVSAMETVGNEKIKEYQAVEKQLLDLKKNGQEFPKELYDKYSNLGVEINQISGNIQKYSDQIQKNKSDLGTIEQEYDLFKRGYGDMDNFMGNAIATSGELANGIFGAVNYFASLSPDPITRLNSMRGQEIANKISGKLEEYRGALRKPVESVESAEGFVNYASDLVANQLPVLAVTSTGAGGLATLGASTTGQTFTKLNQEVLTGKANYTPLQMAAIPLLQGGFEVISEIPTLSILKKGSRVLSAAANGEIDLIKKSGGEIFKDYAKDFGKEFGGEHITNLGQNFNAKYVQGKDEVGLLDNTGRVSKDTAFLTTLLQGSPHVFGAVAKVFQSNNDLGTLDENSRKIIEFSKQLNTEGLTDTEKTVIQKQIDKVTDDSSKIVANTIGKIGDMPNVSYDEIVSLNSQAGKIKAQAKEIKDGNLPNKKELLTSLGEDYKALQIKRSGLIDGSITPFDLLSGNEQAKRLTQASREITKRDNPDGTKEKFEVKPEDAKELASENYLKEIKYKENEQTPPTTEAQPQAEVPQQAEAEKVAEVSPVEDVVATSVEKPKDIWEMDSKEFDDNIIFQGAPTSDSKSRFFAPSFETSKQYAFQLGATEGEVRLSHYDNLKKEQRILDEDLVTAIIDRHGKQWESLYGKELTKKEYERWSGEFLLDNANVLDKIPASELKKKGFNPHTYIVEKAIAENKYIEAINDKKLTVDDAIKIIKSANLEVPKNILDLKNEKSSQGNSTIDASIRPTASNVGESGNSKQESPVQESVPSSVDGGEVKGDASVGEFSEFEKVVNESKSVDEAFDKIKNIKGVSSETSKSFREKYDPKGDLSIKEAFGKFYDEVKAKTVETAQVENKQKSTTKERIAERIKLSDAKIDDWKNAVNGIDSIFGIKIKVDDIEGLNKNGIDIVEVIANIAKQAIAAGIHIDEAINKTIEHLKKTIDFDVNIDEIKERINPNKEAESKTEKETSTDKDMEDFRDSWNLDPSSDEINQYDSGRTIAREHGETRNNQDYEVQKDFARVQIGIRAIEHAKRLFGAEYVEKTLSFIEQANLSPEKKAVAYVLLENEMDARAKEFPKNVGVQKLQDLVRAKSQEFLANSARAMGAGRFRVERFRELAKNGFSEEEFTNAILTTKQKNDKGKIQKLIQVSPDDINNESEYQESDEDFVIEEPTVKRNKEAVKKDISNVLAQMRKDLLKVAKGNVAMSSIPYAAQLQAVAPHIIKLSKLLAELGGMTTRQIVNEVYNDIKEVFPGINKTDVSDILKEHSIKKAKPKTEAQEKQDSVKEIVKKALIEKGFSREITVTKNQRDASGKLVKDADGRNVKIKEKRTVLDWKKLAGEAGTISNIRKNVEESLKGSKYSKAEINEMKKALEREYVSLTSDVIEKGLNELQNRNADRKPVNTKSAAKKLAELYNYGLFEKNKDSYEKIINSVLGFNGLDQMAFDEMKEIARGYSFLMDSGLSDTEIKSAVNSLSRRQSRLVATLAFSQADWKFKLAVALSEITNLSTRFKLVNLGNLAENISSGMMARAANNMMDAMANIASGKKTSSKAIKAQSKVNARAKLRGITLEAAESYGDTSSLLLNHSAVEDYFNNATTNKVYHAIISTYMAKPVLEGADSFNKILITEAKMVRATIKVLEAKGMSNSDALDYVAKAITGESMKEALVKAKALIEKVNEDAGRKLLNDSESSIKSLAADIVKESLVSGGQLSETELKAIYTAAYKSAGKDIGHVSNNWVTDQISAKGAQIEKKVADAIKEKKWSNAAGAVVNQIIWKNFISTFVGGGTNWFVKGLQKSANPLSLVSLRDDVMQLKMAGKLDVTTDEGIKNMEESLYRGMNLRSTSATMLMGAIITASIIGGLSASGGDDEIAKWLKENKWAKKYFDKMVPDAVVLMLAIKDKDFGRYIAKMVNVKADFFDDQKNTYKILEKYAKGYTEDDAVKISDASGDLGAMLGKRFEFPGPVRAAKDGKQIYKGLVKGEYDKTNYYTSGFLNGFFQGGIVESFGLRKDPDFIEDDPIQKFLKKQEKIKEYHALPQSEKDKVDSNAKIPSLRGAITEQENMKYAIKTKTPYYVKGDSEPIDLSDITIAEIDETIADLKKSIEEMKKEAGDRYTEPND